MSMPPTSPGPFGPDTDLNGPFGSGEEGPFGPPAGAVPLGKAASPTPGPPPAAPPVWPPPGSQPPAGGFGPPPGGSPFGGSAPPPGGGVKLRTGHFLLGRFLMVGISMFLSFGITAVIIWFAVFNGDGGDDIDVDLSSPTFPTTVSTAPASTELPPSSSTPGDPGATTLPGATTTPALPPGPALPADWPTALAPPEGATIKAGNGSAETQLILVYELATPAPQVAEALRAQLTAAGLAITTDAFTPDGSTGSLQAAGAGQDATVAVSQAPGASVTTVSWVLRPES